MNTRNHFCNPSKYNMSYYTHDVKPSLTVERILSLVSAEVGISKHTILSPQRDSPIADARKIAMYLMHDELKMNFVEIGLVFDRERTTVMHSVNVAKDFILYDKAFKKRVEKIKQKINQNEN